MLKSVFCVLFISRVIFFHDSHKVVSFLYQTSRLHDAQMRVSPKSRAVFFSATSLHVPHKEKRLHPTKAFTGMRQVSQVGERKRGVKREGGFYRKDAVKSFSPIFPFSAPIFRSGAFLTSACLARFFLRVYVTG